MKRSAMKRGKPLKRTAIQRRRPAAASRSPQGVRKAEADALLDREGEKRYVRARGLCERCKVKPATQRHHVVRRSNHVDHNVENLRCLCLWCHDHVHREIEESKREGWIATDWPQLTGPE